MANHLYLAKLNMPDGGEAPRVFSEMIQSKNAELVKLCARAWAYGVLRAAWKPPQPQLTASLRVFRDFGGSQSAAFHYETIQLYPEMLVCE